ncbi:MAG TPA: two-component regulator propeller domain-containing protein, partial [Pelobium sp.]|nr:two-component regulator propeller domain-containing protein [Pelobium sp.]
MTSIKQDKYGFLWFGTRGGLNKYDGYNIKLLRNHPSSTNNLSSQAVEAMFAGKNFLWIGTKTGGLNKYSFLNDSVTSYPIPYVGGVVDIFSVFEAKNGDVYVGSSKGFYCLDHQNQKFEFIDRGVVNSIISDEKGGIWAATTISLRHYDKTNKLIEEIKFNYKTITLTSLALHKSTNTLYVGTWNRGLFAYNYVDKTFKQFLNQPNDINSLSNNNTYRVLLDKSGALWVGTWGGGLNKFNISAQTFTRYVFSTSDNLNYINKVILSIEQDKSGVIWFGTEGGIHRINPQKKQFNNITYQSNNPNSLLNTHIVSILKDSNNALWIGTKDRGLEYAADGKTFVKVKLPTINEVNLRVNKVYQNKNKLWIGSNDGLYIIDGLKPTDKINRFTTSTLETSLSSNKITTIVKDNTGVIWLGTQDNGLNRVIGYDENGGPKVKRYLLSASKGKLQSERITSIFNDRSNR